MFKEEDMKYTKFKSSLFKLFLIPLFLVSILLLVYVMPTIAKEIAQSWKELEHLQTPILLITQVLILFFMIGLGVLAYLSFKFDHQEVYTLNFTKSLNLLSILSYLSVAGIVVIYLLLKNEGGPGPGEFIALSVLSLIIILAGLGFSLLADTIKTSSNYSINQ